MNKNECFVEATKILEQRRLNAKIKQEHNIALAYKNIPELKRINKALHENMQDFLAVALSDANSNTDVRKFKDKSLDLQTKRAEVLFENKYPLDFLQLQFECKICEDEGYIDGHMCKCLKKLLSEEYFRRSNLALTYANQTFKNFNISYFSKNDNDKLKMENLINFSKSYVKKFNQQSPNVLLSGIPGCGKTFISCCIGAELINNGFFVIYTPVQDMITAFEAEKFGKPTTTDTSVYLNCDLLIMDDLGTEFQTQYSDSVLYNVINSRINMKKPIIISTNYEPNEMAGLYHDRLISRLTYEFASITFPNIDVRKEKKVNNP